MKPTLLKKHFSLYPMLEPTDAVKLVYQNEFGCGHLIADEAACAARITQEESSVAEAEVSAAVSIGNKLCRLDLRHASVRALPPERLARMMAATANEVHGSLSSFLDKLNTLGALAQAGEAPFFACALSDYLADYALRGYPAVSHSPAYRAAYAPAYRVVYSDYALALPVIAAIEERLRASGRAVVVLDGDCGAGKTTLGARLAALYDCNLIHMDDFFLPAVLRTPERFAQPGGNIHHERFAAEVLTGLQSGRPFSYERFDFHQSRSQTVTLAPRPVTLIEGSYSLHPALLPGYDALNAVRVLLTVDPAEQLRRIRLRSGEKLLERFRTEWIPLEKSYFEAYHRGSDALRLCSAPWEEDEP